MWYGYSCLLLFTIGVVFYSPLEQFEIFPLISLNFLSFTNSSFFVFLTIWLILTFYQMLFVQGGGFIIPSRWQAFGESLYLLIVQMVKESLGDKGRSFLPFIFATFTFLLISNLLGLVPYSFTVGSHLIVTLSLALSIWVGKLLVGFRLHGLKLFAMFLPQGIPFAMAPFFVIIELIGFIIPAISLSVRLFANLMSGHILLKVIFGFAWSMMLAGGVLFLAHFIPLGLLFLLFGLESAVAVIQAYVFTVLTCIYLSDMVHGGH